MLPKFWIKTFSLLSPCLATLANFRKVKSLKKNEALILYRRWTFPIKFGRSAAKRMWSVPLIYTPAPWLARTHWYLEYCLLSFNSQIVLFNHFQFWSTFRLIFSLRLTTCSVSRQSGQPCWWPSLQFLHLATTWLHLGLHPASGGRSW